MKIRLFILIILIASLLWTPVPVQAKDIPGDPETPAPVARISTITIQPYLPFQTATAHIQEAYSGAMGTLFTFDVGSFGIDHVSNLIYTANGGVSCDHDANLYITCTGSISQVTIDFDFTYIASDYISNTIWWGYRGNSNYNLEYTFNLIYPAPLEYVRSYSQAPVSVTDTQITWYQESTQSLTGAALFRDPRVHAVYLPHIQR